MVTSHTLLITHNLHSDDKGSPRCGG